MRSPRIWIAVGLVAALVGGGAWWFSRRGDLQVAHPHAAQAVKYTCPMHPQIIRDEPGNCPICQMTLVPVSAHVGADLQAGPGGPEGPPLRGSEEGGLDERGPVVMTAEKRQLIGLTTGAATVRSLTLVIRAVGKVAYDPDLYRTQEEYLGATEDLKASSRLRLTLMGMSKEEITALEQAGRADRALILAGEGGRAWVYADLYAGDLEQVRPGQIVEVEVRAARTPPLRGIVMGVTPGLNEITRTARARVLLSGDGAGRLRSEMYAEAAFRVPLGARLAVPESAVLDSGTARYVFVQQDGGRLVPRRVRVGAKAEGWYEVLEGLRAGETVVTSGNFLVDSESRLREIMGEALDRRGHAGH